ncbi:hypothetical protein EB796_024972 [Bugula neritina]|uniref:Uncharacterized protein n=1 Tax=Bugula neritina TaxID=10212 RepID=A0A7J7ISB2_BUGNE|nr:hypothetical protein EB796_024972 [Bugula neritina]
MWLSKKSMRRSDVNLTKEKPSIKTTTAFTQTVVKETCGIAVQTNSKVVRDASSQQSRVETREYGSQPVAISTANGNTQTDVALDLQTTGTQMEYDRLYIHPLPTIEEEEWEVDVPATCRNISKKDVLDEAIKSMAELASLTNSFLNDVSTRSNSADMIGLGVPRGDNNDLQVDLNAQDDRWETSSVDSFEANKPDVKLAYNSKENVAVLTTKDGDFDLEDYGKKAFQRSAGQRDSRISPHLCDCASWKVSDTSFIPAEAESFCFNGYQWITIGQQTADSGHGKEFSTYLIL